MSDRVIDNLVWQNPDRLSGAVCFFGTRLPVSMLFDWLAASQSVEEFSRHFEIPREQIVGVLKLAEGGLLREMERLSAGSPGREY